MEREKKLVEKLVEWCDTRLGLTYPLLRPVPQYSLNPFYWLGALTVVAFIIQGITGVILMLYYIPSPDSAYTSTQYIFQSVYFGQFLETVHLYTAYAMIMLAFMHMMRGYFVSVQKNPREAMWVVGMIMGFVTLGFGFTGYLLPWTVVSKAGTDVGVGMVSALPQPVSSFITFLIVGAGGDATQLLRFYDLHVVVLPAVLLALLAVKMWMLEAHGISEPPSGEATGRATALAPIFPDVTLYLLELAAIFGTAMLLFSLLFPLQLGPAYTPQAAAAVAAQPDWYFLWIYQVLKISLFEGNGLPVALTAVSAVILLLVILPFIDRGTKRAILDRPVYVTLGAIFIAEVAVLAGWGLVTPGQIISTLQAVEVLGGTAAIVGFVFLTAMYAARPRGHVPGRPAPSPHVPRARMTVEQWSGAAITALAGLGALGMGVAIDSIVKIGEYGMSATMLYRLVAALVGLGVATFLSIAVMYGLAMRANRIKRRVVFLERRVLHGL